MEKKDQIELNERSKHIRMEAFKLSKANGGYHYGGSFSAAEILIALYDHVLTDNDKFILSKGHSCWPYYVLLREKGFNPKLEAHPTLDESNGVHCTTGSLGHGLPTGLGMAWAKKLKNESGKVYVLMGDGECQEGTLWESLLIADHRNIDNIVAIIDNNKIQGSGFVKDILPINCLEVVAKECGWKVLTINGHSNNEIKNALTHNNEGKPLMIIANTVKGKGVSFMENRPEWHAQWPGGDFEKQLIKELE